MKKASIVGLFGRQLGLETLKGILNDGLFELKAVVTHYYEVNMEDVRPLFKEFVKICEENSIPLIVVHKNQENLKILENLDFDFIVSNCYKYIIPNKFLGFAKVDSLNMHRSLLPKYKGLKPLRKALENKDKEAGTTLHRMVAEVDSGDIIDQYKIPVEEGDTEQSLFEKLYPTQYHLLKRGLLKILEKNGEK